MSRVADRVTPSISKSERILPLQNGDHLSREEFERRYDATPYVKRAELIQGIVYIMSPPISFGGHAVPQNHLITLLGNYSAATPGLGSGAPSSLRLDDENMPEPDAFLLILPSYGGQARIDEDDYVGGAPEMVVEIAASSASLDLHQKMEAYRRSGVREYLVWRTLDEKIELFILKQGKYKSLAAGPDGLIRSKCFPGLWLNVTALLKDDLAAALQTLQQGIASSEHQTFAKALRDRAAKQ